MSSNRASGRIGKRFVVVLLCVVAAAGTACSDVVAESSTCRNLVYKDGEVPRAQYVPCAGEIVSALEELDRHTEAAFNGNRQARSDGQATLRRVIGLMNAAGGRQLLERWNDSALMDLNANIQNAVSHYQAFYMVRILDEPDRFAATSRDAARTEFVNGRRRYNDASRLYRRLR